MSLFLIVYNRTTGAVDVRATFDQGQAPEAVRARFALEQELQADGRSPVDTEVVVLSGESQEELRRTHARYFDSVQELLVVPDSATETEPRRRDGA